MASAKHNDKIVDQHTLQAGEYARMIQAQERLGLAVIDFFSWIVEPFWRLLAGFVFHVVHTCPAARYRTSPGRRAEFVSGAQMRSMRGMHFRTRQTWALPQTEKIHDRRSGE